MADELKAAVDRFRNDSYPATFDGKCQFDKDETLLADAYIAHLDAQAAREAERAKLIDEALLLSTGGEYFQELAVWRIAIPQNGGSVCLRNRDDGFIVTVSDADDYVIRIGAITTCGELMDLLAALKVEVRGLWGRWL